MIKEIVVKDIAVSASKDFKVSGVVVCECHIAPDSKGSSPITFTGSEGNIPSTGFVNIACNSNVTAIGLYVEVAVRGSEVAPDGDV